MSLAIGLTALLVVCWVVYRYWKPATNDPDRLTRNVVTAAASAGGLQQLYNDAEKAVADLGQAKSDLLRLQKRDLAKYPAIASLGGMAVIVDGSYLRIRVGDHINGYTIFVYPGNSTLPTLDRREIPLHNGRVIVSR